MIKFPKKILEGIEVHLVEERKRVSAQIAELAAQDPFADTDRLSDNAASDAEANEEINHERYQALLMELKEKQTAIAAALVRIESGSYGFCASCRQMIDTERLAAIPTATLCMTCEAKKKR